MAEKREKVKAIFEKACPNCGGPISDLRLSMGLPCSKCLPRIGEDTDQDLACVELDNLGKLKKDFKEICELKEFEVDFESFFWSIHKSKPWSLQKAWAKRFFLKRSFALLAPTGIGKTTFGLTLAFYLARQHKKSYLIFPTRLLVEQAILKLRNMGVPEEYMLYFGEKKSLTKKQREERLNRLREGDFRILISTSMFLYRHVEDIPKGVWELIFVDDVDSFLKTAKNIDKALYLMGFTEKDIEWAMNIIRLRKKLAQNPKTPPEEWKKLREQEEKLRKHAEKVRKGVLIVSSATSNPRSERIKLFRELLGFEVGRPLFYLRNVVDAYEDQFIPEGQKSLENHKPLWDFVAEFVKEHPKGGLIYISQDRGREEVDELVEYLNSKGLNVKSYEEIDKHLKDYEEGKVNAFVGIASYRNPLARGFDMPHVVRYALFVGVPKLKFTLKVEEHISHILWALVAIRPLIAKDKELREKYLQKLDKWIEKLRKYSYLSEEFIEQNERLKEIIENIRSEVREFIEHPEILEKIKQSDEITLRWDEKEGYSLIVADVTGYLQASGRTSRLFPRGLTKGFSLVLVDDLKAFNNLKKKVKWFSEDIEFIPLKEVDLKTLFEEIEKDRELVKQFLEGKVPKEVKELIRPVLVIVESPNKARTIANFFGKPLRRRVGEIDVMEVSLGDKFLTIAASAGHVYDLIKKNEGNIFHGVIVEKQGKDVKHFIPIYEPIVQEMENEERSKEEIINSLRQVGLEVSEVYIGTDPDTEGEKIAWDLFEVIKPYNRNIKRMEFHEVTKRAIIEAINQPREMDINLVEAQMVRRIADRWVGFELSQLLQEHFKKPWLSAGRVQTPVLGWVIERDKLYRTKKGAVYVYLPTEESKRRVSLVWEFEDKKLAKEFFKNLTAVDIKILEKRSEEKKPAPPYTTDAMLKDASEKLRFSASKTMQLAQELFEMGLCVTGDTEVVLKDGQIKPIGDIVEQSQEKDLIAFKGRTFEVCCAEANKFWKIPYKGTLKVIKLSNGLEIKTTPDHGLFVYRDRKFGWVSAKNLNRGDYVAVPFGYRKTEGREIGLLELLLELDITDVTLQFKEYSKSFAKKVEPVIRKTVKSSVKYKYLRRRIVPLKVLLEGDLAKEEILLLEKDIETVYHQKASSKPIPLFKLYEKFWYFVGLVLGDGSLSQKAKITIAQTPTKRVKEFLEELFPFLKISESSNGSVVIYSSLLREILKKLGTRKGQLHPLIFTLKEDYINALIAGYFDTDGTASLMFDKKVQKPSLRVAITSKREEVLRKLHIYLNSVGILTTVRGSKSRTAKDLIFSNLTIDRFTEKIGKYLRIRKEQLQKALEEYRKHHKKVFNGDILPFADLVKALHFPKGVKNKLLTEKGIDVWNYLKENGKKGISRDRLKEIIKTLKVYGENEILRFLEQLIEQPLTWVKVEDIKEEPFEGYLYDFTTSESSFIANGVVSHNCTYHRTDSTRVSDVGISVAKEYIDENFGHDYFYPRHWGEGGAHECIRPTHPWDVEELRSMMLAGQIQRLTREHLRLYELIFKRFMASQMRPAEVEVTKFEATPVMEKEDLPKPKLEDEVITSVLRDGFNLITPIEVYYLKEGTFKVVEQKEFTDEEGQKVEEHLNSAMKIYKLVPLAYPYTQGSLIEEMKKRGIGRPSTYAQIVQKLLDRGYVIERKNFLFPTKLGKEVYNYLIRLKEAEKFVKEEFTRILEELMDKIEQGQVYYIDVLKDLYWEVLRIEKLRKNLQIK